MPNRKRNNKITFRLDDTELAIYKNRLATSTMTQEENITLNPIEIMGTVTDAATGNPIPGATVDVGDGRRASTDATGHYSINRLDLGDYTVNAVATGYNSNTGSTTLTTAEPYKTVNLILTEIPAAPPTGSISGQITDAATGNPIPWATVNVGGGTTTTADATGYYSFNNLDMGSYTVNASATGYTSGTGNTTLTPSDTDKTVNIALVPITGSISGQITDAATGNPIPGATVDMGGGRTANTDAAGHYANPFSMQI